MIIQPVEYLRINLIIYIDGNVSECILEGFMAEYPKGLSRKKITEMMHSLGSFSGGQLQDFNTLLIVLEMNGYTIEDFRKMFNHIQRKNSLRKISMKGHSISPLRCPRCDIMFASIFPVNTMHCDVVGGEYNSQVVCGDWKVCGWEIYSKKTVEQWRSHIMLVGPERSFDVPDDYFVGPGEVREKKESCGGCGKKN
jgi:hypothetical protein